MENDQLQKRIYKRLNPYKLPGLKAMECLVSKITMKEAFTDLFRYRHVYTI